MTEIEYRFSKPQTQSNLEKMKFEDWFSFQIFFIFLRESLEIVVIVSILLTIVKQSLSSQEETEQENPAVTLASTATVPPTSDYVATILNEPMTLEEEEQTYDLQPETYSDTAPNNDKLYKKLKLQILSGGGLGLLLCLIIGGIFIVVFYHIGADLWSVSEHYYEGILSIVASVIISVMGLFFLRIGKLREKFRVKLASIVYSDRTKFLDRHKHADGESAVKFTEKYAFFILPFITALREGLEAVVFIGGIGIDKPLTSIPLSMLSAVVISVTFGTFFFEYSNTLSLKICLVGATGFLYMIAAGLFSKGVWQLELQDYVNKCNGQDMSEVGSGPGSYDISKSVWHVNCCNGETDGGWMIFTAIFGWTNSATYGSVISYIVYWTILISFINLLMIEEKLGYIPFLPISWQRKRILKRLNVSVKALKLKQSSSPDNLRSRISKDSRTPLIEIDTGYDTNDFTSER